ncbi:MAG: adenine deaminase [Anaerolineae bacterium]
MELEELIEIARGEKEADLLLKNGRLVNVLSGDIYETDVAIAQSWVVGFGQYPAKETIDLKGDHLCPGFIDGHMHIESSMVQVSEFARVVVPKGTTTIIIDPHEIANVMGLDGIRYMLESSKYNPLSVYLMLPSAVPATDMETAGSRLRDYHLAPFLHDKWVLGVAEMMNYPGVFLRDPDAMAKIIMAGDKRIDGHAPGLSGRDLAAYVAAGIASDHECTTLEEAQEKLRLGMYIMMRDASVAHNLDELLPLVTPQNARRCMLVTDDRHPADLIDEGHINHLVKKTIAQGIHPISAIQMATVNTAEYFGLKDKGAIAPGRRADLIVVDNFEDFNVKKVFRGGKLVAEDGEILPGMVREHKVALRSAINVDMTSLNGFKLEAKGKRAKVIQIVPDQIITRQLVREIKQENGWAVSDVERDILKLAVVERHQASGNVGLGFVQGFGLKRGAIASSVAHDSHNIIVTGTNDDDMVAAVEAIVEMRGGFVAVDGGQTLATLPLPIAGLISDQSMWRVRAEMGELLAVTQRMGSHSNNPFMSLSFLALPVIPELKLTDRGLVDVKQFKFVPLFED